MSVYLLVQARGPKILAHWALVAEGQFSYFSKVIIQAVKIIAEYTVFYRIMPH